jgi:hypothetical protein
MKYLKQTSLWYGFACRLSRRFSGRFHRRTIVIERRDSKRLIILIHNRRSSWKLTPSQRIERLDLWPRLSFNKRGAGTHQDQRD